MSRYNSYSGNGTSGNNNDDDFDDITLKLQKYATLSVTGKRVNAFESQYGDKFVVGFDGVRVLDGIVFQREDAPSTWKVFSLGKFFDMDPDTGVVLDSDGNEMASQDILDHPRVLGFSETFGGTDYFYKPVGAVCEATDDLATNNDLDVETQDTSIVVGEVSMLLSNKSWTRTLAKLLTEEGDTIIETYEDENGNEQALKDASGWLTTLDPTQRDGIEGREMELFIIEESGSFGDDEEKTWTTPILLDSKTGNRITIDNFGDDDSEAEAEAEPQPAATDGGAVTQQPTETETETETPDEPEPEAIQAGADESAADEAPEADIPDVLDDLLRYFARTDGEDTTVEDLREFAEDEVDDADAVDWDACLAEVHRMAAEGDY